METQAGRLQAKTTANSQSCTEPKGKGSLENRNLSTKICKGCHITTVSSSPVDDIESLMLLLV